VARLPGARSGVAQLPVARSPASAGVRSLGARSPALAPRQRHCSQHPGPARPSACSFSAEAGEPPRQPSVPATQDGGPPLRALRPYLTDRALAAGRPTELAGSRCCQALASAALAHSDDQAGRRCPRPSARLGWRVRGRRTAGSHGGFGPALTRRCPPVGVTERQVACPAVADRCPLPYSDPQARWRAQLRTSAQHSMTCCSTGIAY
jgi:hypothetical protein